METERTYTAFLGMERIVTGDLRSMLLRTKEEIDRGRQEALLIFDDLTGQQVDFDLGGTPDQVLERALPQPTSGRGRPKLGVVSREVSLLPRHWEWLEDQPNGASAALRRLVDEARKREPALERARRARDAASRFMWSMAGNLPDFEEATRALFASDGERLRELIRPWPKDVRDHVDRMVQVSESHARDHDGAASGGAQQSPDIAS
jgi:hypothetical protein